MDRFDVTIIGAGVIGLAVARSVSTSQRKVLVLERNSSFGEEASSRNSEVIHAGIYYPQGSLKALSCVEGRRMLYDLCQANGIGCRKTGKLIVACDKQELSLLNHVACTAEINGVALERMSQSQVHEKEAQVACLEALYSPETGIVDSHRLMEYYLEQARGQGADVVYAAEVTALHQQKQGWDVTVNNQGEELSILSRVVVNCSGLNADKVAALAGLDTAALGYAQYYLKGSYFRLSDKYRHMTRHLVYPVPDKNSLGIHTVLDLAGGLRLGPNEEEVSEIDYSVRDDKGRAFYEAARKFLPCIALDDLTPDMAGIRAQLSQPNRGDFKDFVIREEREQGCPGLINCVGIESPGLTASAFIGQYVADLARDIL